MTVDIKPKGQPNCTIKEGLKPGEEFKFTYKSDTSISKPTITGCKDPEMEKKDPCDV